MSSPPVPDLSDPPTRRPERRLDLRGMDLEATQELVRELGEPGFRAEQIFRWVHQRGVSRIEDMRNLSKELRARIAERCFLTTLAVDLVQTSRDGTRKMRLLTEDGKAIETVLIPERDESGDKLTQCISSQVGCALDCQFCATGKLGLTRHLGAGEIVDQVYRARELLAELEPGRRITNIVYMGMGEPLHNYDNLCRSLRVLNADLGANLSQRRMTVSTVGLVPKIERLGQETVRPNLAVSLNASNDEVRDQVMPVNKRWNIDALLSALRRYPLEKRRRITFEYVLLAGVNDSVEDAARVAKLLAGIPSKLNVIPWNPHEGAPYRRPSAEAIERFQSEARRRGLATYLRVPRGDDIDAACGQLAAKKDQLVELRRRP